jgi:hypothetical protein
MQLDLHGNIQKTLPAIIIGSLTIVAGLAWNNAFIAIINQYIPADNQTNAWFKVVYAFVLTMIIIVVISVISIIKI